MGESLFLHLSRIQLQKSLNILKWIGLALTFWVVLALLLIVAKPALPAAFFYLLLAGFVTSWWFVFKKIKHKLSFFVFFILLFLSLWSILHVPSVQTWLVGKVTASLSKKLGVTISIKHVDLDFFDKLDLRGVYVQDQHKDTFLYAGTASIRITDWFFLKDKATVHYLGLSDATININRKTDTVWNYQFLVDYFSGPKKKESKGGGIQLSVQELNLQNIALNQVDKWKGKDQLLSLKSLHLLADTFDLDKQLISISKLDIDQPSFTINDYTGIRDRLNLLPPAKAKDTSTQKPGELVISVKNLHITNGIFANEKENNERAAYTYDRFDGSHIRFANINADMQQLRFAKDTLTTNITLATKERSGFEVKKLQAKMKFSAEIMEFNELDLQTNQSKLGDYYSMRYEDFDEDMGHFLHNIRVEGHFKNSELYSDDLAYFDPSIKSWKRIFRFSGHAKGRIDNLSASNMNIQSGNSSIVGDIKMKGLPDLDSTFIDLDAREFNTTYSELVSIVPSLKEVTTPKLDRLGNIGYRGNFTGFLRDFVAFGTINTSLGTVTGDLNLKLPSGKPAIYSGNVSTQNFRLGQFLDESKLGPITFKGKVGGSGFSAQTLDARFDGDIKGLEYKGYNYQNIVLKGDFKKKLFSGFASINDPNLKLDELSGTIDFNKAEPEFDFDASLAQADFKKLGFTKEDYQLKGKFNFNFTGDDIDNFLGTARIREASLLHNGQPLSFDSLELQSEIVNGQKYLSLRSNEVDAHIQGNFNIAELPDAFNVFLSRYFPAYIQKPGHLINDQDFSFEIQTKQVSNYIELLDPKLKGFDNSTISGSLQLNKNDLIVNADVPSFSYDGKAFNYVRLQSRGNLDSLFTNIDIEDVALSDSLHLPMANLSFTSGRDTSNISIRTSTGKTISEAYLNARVVTKRNGARIHFFPSSLIINDNKWQLEKDGEIDISNNELTASDIRLAQGNQEIKIATEPSGGPLTTNDVVIDLTKVHVDDIATLGFSKPQIDGQMTGTIRIEDPFGKPFMTFDTKTEEVRLDNDSLGTLTAKGSYNFDKGVLAVDAHTDSKDNMLDISGTINFKDDSTGNNSDIAIKSDKFNLSLLNSYLDDIFSDINGIANTSDLKITGSGKHLQMTGTAFINEGSLVVKYTQCKYKFKNESIVFNPDEIDFGEITLKDTLNNTATLSGKMYHRFFNDIEFDSIHLKSDRLLVLNTTRKDNNLFYGKVFGKADLVITGNEDNILMNISGEPSVRDTSHIYIVSGNSIESDQLNYIDFIQFGTEMEQHLKTKTDGSILVDMKLTANPFCKVDVILDEETGDVIHGEGESEGPLRIRVGNKEDLSINGKYNITKGNYTFNFQTLLKKYFTVNSGSSIVWSGDPYKANIDITAEYLATNVDFSSLSSGASYTNGLGSFNQKSDVKVLAHLTQTLLKPEIAFSLELPPNNPNIDFLVQKRLQQFQQDKNELNKQITSLLLFGSFINPNQSLLNATAGYNVLSGTIGGMVSGVVSNFLNTFVQKIPNLKFDVDLNTTIGSDLQTNVEKLQAAARSKFVYTLLNGRLIITAGLNLDYNNPYANINRNTNLLITPDITVEWILNKSGRLRVVGFNRTNYDLVGQRNRTGASLSYRRDFEHLPSIFSTILFWENRQRKKNPATVTN